MTALLFAHRVLSESGWCTHSLAALWAGGFVGFLIGRAIGAKKATP